MLLIFLLSFLPSFLKNFLYSLIGFKLGDNVSIGPGVIINSTHFEMKDRAKIKPFTVILSNDFLMKADSQISSFSFLYCSKIILDKYAKISPLAIIMSSAKSSSFFLGRHSQVFPFCWIEPEEGVYIGNDSGIGGHTLIFTHGVWTDYLQGGPIQRAPVHIGNGVWLPWRVFIMPGTNIADNSIIAAGSVMSGKTNTGDLYAGIPAKLVKPNYIGKRPSQEVIEKTQEIFNFFKKNYHPIKYLINSFDQDTEIIFFINSPSKEDFTKIQNKKCHFIDYESKKYYYPDKINFQILECFRRFGIRLDIEKLNRCI